MVTIQPGLRILWLPALAGKLGATFSLQGPSDSALPLPQHILSNLFQGSHANIITVAKAMRAVYNCTVHVNTACQQAAISRVQLLPSCYLEVGMCNQLHVHAQYFAPGCHLYASSRVIDDHINAHTILSSKRLSVSLGQQMARNTIGSEHETLCNCRMNQPCIMIIAYI